MFKGRGRSYNNRSYSRFHYNKRGSFNTKVRKVRPSTVVTALISYINEIGDMSKACGISKECITNKINEFGIKVYNTYITYQDAILLMDSIKINYKLDKTCTVEDNITKSIIGTNINKLKITVTILGHINHGKTTLISDLLGRNVIEDHSITQNITVYEKNDFALLDTPGHQIFSQSRKNIISITDCFVLVVSLSQGIELETSKILHDLQEHDLLYKLLVVFTKQDIAKYSPESLIKQINKEINNTASYIVYDTKSKNKLFDTILSITDSNNTLVQYNNKEYNGEVIKFEVIDGVVYNLVKLIKGNLQKGITIFSDINIKAEVTKLLTLDHVQIHKQVDTMGYYYIATSKPLKQQTHFITLDNKDLISLYSKVIVAKQIILSENELDQSAIQQGSRVKYIFVVGDSITQEVVNKIIIDNNLNNNSKVVLYNNQFSPYNYQNARVIIFYNHIPCDSNLDSCTKTKIVQISNIYQLLAFIKEQSTDIADNPNVTSAASVIKVFNIKGSPIAGCIVKHGSFSMHDQVSVTVEQNEDGKYNINNAIKTKIISLKSRDTFVKKTKANKEYGIVLKGVWDLKVGMYIFKTLE